MAPSIAGVFWRAARPSDLAYRHGELRRRGGGRRIGRARPGRQRGAGAPTSAAAAAASTLRGLALAPRHGLLELGGPLSPSAGAARPRATYLCVEIKILRRVRAESPREPLKASSTPSTRRRLDARAIATAAAASQVRRRAPRNDLVLNCRVHPTHWLISTRRGDGARSALSSAPRRASSSRRPRRRPHEERRRARARRPWRLRGGGCACA